MFYNKTMSVMSIKRIILLIIAAFTAISAVTGRVWVFNPTWDFGASVERLTRVIIPSRASTAATNRCDRRGDLLRLHGARILAPTLLGRQTQVTVTYIFHEPPGTFTQAWVYSNERKKVASITDTGQCHAAREPRGSSAVVPGRPCGWPRRSAPSPIYIRCRQVRGRRLCQQRLGPHRPALAASAGRETDLLG